MHEGSSSKGVKSTVRITVLLLLAAGMAGCATESTETGGDASDDGDKKSGNGDGDKRDGSVADGNQEGENMTKIREVVYESSDLIAGASPGTAFLEDVYEYIPVAEEHTFMVEAGVDRLSFSEDAWAGTGSGRAFVYGPEGDLVYASDGYDCVGNPDQPLACAIEQVAEQNGPYDAGEYDVMYRVAGVMKPKLKITATYLVPENGSANDEAGDAEAVPG